MAQPYIFSLDILFFNSSTKEDPFTVTKVFSSISLTFSLRKLKTKLFTNIRESLISFPPIMKNTQHLSSSQTSDNITPNNPECSFEKPFY